MKHQSWPRFLSPIAFMTIALWSGEDLRRHMESGEHATFLLCIYLQVAIWSSVAAGVCLLNRISIDRPAKGEGQR